jgi:hypothetical protein
MKKVNPPVGIISTFEAQKDQILGNDYWRDGKLTDEFDNIVVDTVMTTFDTGMPETGISQDYGENWIIVEQYETKEEATIGHASWVKKMKEDPNQKLKDIGLWEGTGDD